MLIEIMQPEVLSSIIPLGLFAVGFGMAYTRAQRSFIIDRDKHKCQAPFKHVCNGGEDIPEGQRRLQVHHILSQRYAQANKFDPDFEENGITLCKNAHIGHDGIHSDIATAHTKEEFERVFEERDKKLANREIYWNPQWDRQLHVIAIRNTQRFAKTGQIFPVKIK